jgi:hypothetical protein
MNPFGENLSQELLRLIRVLTFDGQLTGDEVYLLAQWLNEHPGARETWPGNILFETLRHCFADGELDLDEMIALGSLLAEIDRQCSLNAPQEEDTPPIIGITEESKPSLRVEKIVLPRLNYRGRVKSFTSDDSYELDLDRHTCTCPDWEKVRQNLPDCHAGRACKHIVSAIGDKSKINSFHPPLRALLEGLRASRRGTNPFDEYHGLIIPSGLAVVAYSKRAWVNVYAIEGDVYAQFGYNIPNRRWSYGMSPKGARLLRQAIHDKWDH